MLDVTDRDQAARRGTWELPQGQVDLPAVMHPHTQRRPAPEAAELILARQPVDRAPTVTFHGTALTPDADDASTAEAWSIPRALVYPGSLDASLHHAADARNPEGPVRVVHDVREPFDHEGLVVLPTAREAADDPWKLAGFLVDARLNGGPNAVLYAPGIGRPDQLALAAMAGIDVFDGLVPVLEGLAGRYLTPTGVLDADSLGQPPCPCPACSQGALDAEALVEHNRRATEAEARRVRHAVEDGSLRELVEARVKARPEHVATLRRLDTDHAAFFDARAPSVRERPMPVLGDRSLDRPAVRRWLDRLSTRYTPPDSAEVLVALPCSATKPYQNSPTHQAIRPAIEDPGHGRAHVVTLTSPLGAVPEELELAYPAAHYDVPVTGDWTADEAQIVREAYRRIAKAGGYDEILLHLDPDEASLLDGVFPDAARTVQPGERPTDHAATERLREAVREATSGLEATPRRELFREHMAARVAWQLGPDVAEAMMEGTEIRGRYPYLKLMHGDTQLLMLKPERGALTLTLDGGRRLFEATDAYTIEIDDFHPKGDVFAPGVLDASDGIRVEDEVVIAHEGELRAVGRARAPGPEMAAMTGGSCAEVRHHA